MDSKTIEIGDALVTLTGEEDDQKLVIAEVEDKAVLVLPLSSEDKEALVGLLGGEEEEEEEGK